MKMALRWSSRKSTRHGYEYRIWQLYEWLTSFFIDALHYMIYCSPYSCEVPLIRDFDIAGKCIDGNVGLCFAATIPLDSLRYYITGLSQMGLSVINVSSWSQFILLLGCKGAWLLSSFQGGRQLMMDGPAVSLSKILNRSQKDITSQG